MTFDDTRDDGPLTDGVGVARELNTTERHVRRLTSEGKLPYVKVGGKVRFRRSDLREFIDRHVVSKDGRPQVAPGTTSSEDGVGR